MSNQKGFVAPLVIVLVIVAVVGAFFLGRTNLKVPQNLTQNLTSNSTTQTSGNFQGSDKLGLCDGLSTDTLSDDITDIKALGFGWARPRGDVFAQENIEKGGNFDFSKSDTVVSQLQAANIKIFGTLFPTGIPKIPESVNSTSYANYVKEVVSRYKGKITYWQVGIEPFCQTTTNSCYKNFSDLVRTTYEFAKSVDFSVMISPGGAAPIYTPTGGIDPQSSQIFKYFFDNGGANYIDFFNFHYLVGDKNGDIKKYLDYWRKYLPSGKEIWLSETGSRDVGDRYTISSNEDTEATWVKNHLDASFGDSVSKIFWCRAEHSFSDMPKVVEALQQEVKKYGGNPSGSVTTRQTKTGQGMTQQGGGQMPGNTQQGRQPGMMQQRGSFQQPGGIQQPGGNQQFQPQR